MSVVVQIMKPLDSNVGFGILGYKIKLTWMDGRSLDDEPLLRMIYMDQQLHRIWQDGTNGRQPDAAAFSLLFLF